jgi:hypothetical protein
MESRLEANGEAASPHVISLLQNALGAAEGSAANVRSALGALGQPGTEAIGLRTALKDAFLILHARYEAFEAAGRLHTPWSEVNAQLPRIGAGETLFVIGPNDIRRSALVLQIARHVARATKRAVYLDSTSLSPVGVALRLIAMDASIEKHDLELGRLSDEEWPRISAAITALSALDIRFLGGIDWTEHGARAPLWPLGQKPQLLVLEDADAINSDFNQSSLLTWVSDLARQHSCIVLACTACHELAASSRAALLLRNGNIEAYQAGNPTETDVRWSEDTRRFESRIDGEPKGACDTPG